MIDELGRRARVASQTLAGSTAGARNAALEEAATRLGIEAAGVLDANSADMADASRQGISGALLDRLRLTERRLAAMASGLRKVATQPDPLGEITAGWTMPNGLRISRFRVPLGVVAVIYEARPNVTADAGGLCLKSGNACLLRGSSYALRSNLAIGAIMRDALEQAGLASDALQIVEDTTREGARALMRARQWVDLLVPRGGPGLISAVQSEATVPVVVDGAGNCHVYVDASADLEVAADIVVNAKTSRPGVCNAAEKLLVHQEVAPEFLPRVAKLLTDAGVELRGDEQARRVVPSMVPADEADWPTEYLDLVMAVKVVPNLEAAIQHIRSFGSGHTDAIVTSDLGAADRFVAGTDSAVVMVNASTRFTDGEEFGFGAEIGISTQKLHVRGPMGLEALTSEKYVVRGDGHVRR